MTQVYECIEMSGFWINSDNPNPADVESELFDGLASVFVVLGCSGFDESEGDPCDEQIFYYSSRETREEFMATHGMEAFQKLGRNMEWVCTEIAETRYTYTVTDGVQLREVVDPCVHCGLSTALGSGRFVNRIPSDSPAGGEGGYACAMCAGYECDECSRQILLDEEVRVISPTGENMNYHADCYRVERHGAAQ